MKRFFCLMALILPLVGFSGCKKKSYEYTMKVLRENTQPAQGFLITAWVEGKSEPVSKKTGPDGIAFFNDLPFPDTKNRLNGTVRYYDTKGNDRSRSIAYPFIPSDATRLKDTQYIPNTAAAEL